MTVEQDGPLQLVFDRAQFETRSEKPDPEARARQWRKKYDLLAEENAILRIDVSDLEDEVDVLEQEIDKLKRKLKKAKRKAKS